MPLSWKSNCRLIMPQGNHGIDSHRTTSRKQAAQQSSKHQEGQGSRERKRVRWRDTGELSSQNLIDGKWCGKSKYQPESDRKHTELQDEIRDVASRRSHLSSNPELLRVLSNRMSNHGIQTECCNG